MAEMWRAALITGVLGLLGGGVALVLPTGSSSAVELGGRAVVSVARAGCSMSSPASHTPVTSAGASGTAHRGWSAPAALVPRGTAASSLGLSATPNGSLLAGWVQGPPPMLSAGLGLSRSGSSNATAEQAKTTMQEVKVAEGSFAAGFRRPLELSAGPTGLLTDLQVTLSAPDVGYAVWEQQTTTSLRLSIVCNGERTVSNRQLLSDAVPVALFPLASGRAALVFNQFGHGTPLLEYAVLTSSGRMGAIARIGHPGAHDSAQTWLSVNTHGELIATWVHDDAASPPGSSPASPRFIPAKLVVAVCKPALHCATPTTVGLGGTKPACIDPAVAIGPDGTTTVIAAADDWTATGCDDALGVHASVTRATNTRLQPMHLIQREGQLPVAEPVGRAGTLMVFNPGPRFNNSLAWSLLSANRAADGRPSVLDDNGWWNTDDQALAQANNGWCLITWTHASSNFNPTLSLRAAVGHNGQVEPASVVVGPRTRIDDYVGADDGNGDAIVLFSGSTDRGDGAPWPYSSGLYATTLRH